MIVKWPWKEATPASNGPSEVISSLELLVPFLTALASMGRLGQAASE